MKRELEHWNTALRGGDYPLDFIEDGDFYQECDRYFYIVRGVVGTGFTAMLAGQHTGIYLGTFGLDQDAADACHSHWQWLHLQTRQFPP